jgi:hypothetical protein
MEIITKVHVENKKLLLRNAHDFGQVVVHCHCNPKDEDLYIRIWRTTYLFDNGSDYKSQLVHAENITTFPLWTLIPKNNHHTFTLIFAGLPKSCHSFDLIEVIPENDGFHFFNILRSREDIYEVFV